MVEIQLIFDCQYNFIKAGGLNYKTLQAKCGPLFAHACATTTPARST